MKNFSLNINPPPQQPAAPFNQSSPYTKTVIISLSATFDNDIAAILFSNKLLNLIKDVKEE